MLLGKVVGMITSTRKEISLSGLKFLLIQPCTKLNNAELGEMLVAVDLMGAGVGEEVIVATGRAARLAMGKEDLPIDAAVIGIVDARAES